MLRLAAVISLLVACGGSSEQAERPVDFGGDRPVKLQVPASFDEAKTYPLVLILHGYGASGFIQQAYFGLSGEADRRDTFVLAPDGLVDSQNRQFWNADPYCCDFDGQNPDDVGYLGGVVDDVMDAWPVDPAQVFIIGHSNGGFMSYRLACDRADLFAAIAPLAGNAASVTCDPTRPVNVLHMHGTADTTVPYDGGPASVEQWANHDGCTGELVAGADLDLDSSLAGAETHTQATAGCPAGGAVELWSIEGAGHIPSFSASFEPTIWQWFADHRRDN